MVILPFRAPVPGSRSGLPFRARLEGGNAPFEASLCPSVSTRSDLSDTPDALYYLEVHQYDSTTGARIGGKTDFATSTTIGQTITVPMADRDDCHLVIIARGKTGIAPTLGTKTLKEVQNMTVSSSTIKDIDPTKQDDINKMPYVLHLEHVQVKQVGGVWTIQSPEGSADVRLRLKRLAARLTVTWNYSAADFELKQIMLQSVPLNYSLVDAPDNAGCFPSIVSQFTTYVIPTTDATKTSGTLSYWVPANVRGIKAEAGTDETRYKDTAPQGSTFISFTAENTADSKKKLEYRVYVGTGKSTDFNLRSNTNYNYQVNFNHTSIPLNDKRITYIDPIPASQSNDNFVPTANCFMVEPGGAFCFDPFKYRQDGADIANSKLIEWAGNRGGIAYVKLLWQTRESGDVGDPVIGIANSATDHTNIVEALKTVDGTSLSKTNTATAAGQCRIYCRVSSAAKGGGNGVIAAYDVNDAILWSWHIWVTDYKPDATGSETVLEPSTKRKQKYAYRSDINSFPMMDRNLGALEGYTSVPADEVAKSRANGLHYQWGRKDPFLGSYTTKSINSVAIVSGSATPTNGLQNAYGPDGYTFFPRSSTSATSGDKLEYSFKIPTTVYDRATSNSYVNAALWGASKSAPKTLYDPCPQGWRVPEYTTFFHLFSDDYAGSESDRNADNAALRSVPASDDAGYADYWKKGTGAGIYNDGGVLIKYDATDNTTYYRLTGYQETVNAFNYIGLYANVWGIGGFNSTRVSGFSVNWGASLGGNKAIYARMVGMFWQVSDAQNVRCIQEKE
nr:DUF4906 domain-containing protein [Bacteroides intestinalis]